MDCENLYNNKQIDRYLRSLATKNYISFEDFKQEVFLDVLEHDTITPKGIERASWKIAKRMKKVDLTEKAFCLEENIDSFMEL